MQNRTVLSEKIQRKAWWLSELDNRIIYETFAVQTLLWLLEFLIFNKSQIWQYLSHKPSSALKHIIKYTPILVLYLSQKKTESTMVRLYVDTCNEFIWLESVSMKSTYQKPSIKPPFE